jgi:tRNA-binding protein
MHPRHDSEAQAAEPVTFEQFLAVDIHVGRVVTADPFPEPRKPAYKLAMDFGPAVGVWRRATNRSER